MLHERLGMERSYATEIFDKDSDRCKNVKNKLFFKGHVKVQLV